MTKRADNSKFTACVSLLNTQYKINKNILLIQSPQFLLDKFNVEVARAKGCYAFPPTGLQCLAKALSGRELDIDILDLNYLLLKKVIEDRTFDYMNWLQLLDSYLEKNEPSIIGVTCLTVYSDVFGGGHPLTAILEHLRNKNKYVVIAGGPIAVNEYENYLQKGLCHFVVDGEGENKIQFLMSQIYGDGLYVKPASGIYFNYINNVEESEGSQEAVELKGNLIGTYDLNCIEDYNNVGALNPFSRMAGIDRKFAGIQLNRGCRANCRFCGVIEFMGKGLRQYPVEDVIEEIGYLIREKGIRHFEILDDDFLGYGETHKAVLVLLEKLVEFRKRYKITWAAGNGLTAVSINDRLLSLMRDSGCVGFRIGIESGNEKMLIKMRKPAKLTLLENRCKILQKYPEIFIGGNYIIGLFGEETFGEMLDTFRFSFEMNLDWAAFTTFQVTSKATALAENLKMKGNTATDFIPAKDTSSREIKETGEIISGPEVFSISEDTIPSREQIKQIWFTFNLVANYIYNKNLKPDGRPEKFVSWVEAVHVVYPCNPYMPLFAGLGHTLLGNKKIASRHLKKAEENLKASRYWNNRFMQFGLTDIITNFPQDTKEVQEVLKPIRSRYSKWTKRKEFIDKGRCLNERI